MITHDVPELTDPGSMTIKEWFSILFALAITYGPDATLTLDAGHNNIGATLTLPDEPRGLLHPS